MIEKMRENGLGFYNRLSLPTFYGGSNFLCPSDLMAPGLPSELSNSLSSFIRSLRFYHTHYS